MSYDIIGDIHGHADTLTLLLKKLDYSLIDGVYRHDTRQVVFLGDFIDGGRQQRETLDIVKPMVENGSALAVMGNHEFNAVAYATKSDLGGHLRPRNPDNETQHDAFLAAYPVDSPAYLEAIAWFKTLPLWLDLKELRAVHACWDHELIKRIALEFDGARLTENLLRQASNRTRWEYAAVETLLKGKEIPLPEGYSFTDRYGKTRKHIRIRWYDRTQTTYRGKFLGSKEWETDIPDDEIHGDHAIDYSHAEPPVFFGHYWLSGTPKTMGSNVACLDYSVAKPGGKLVAYRWDGKPRLHKKCFIAVGRVEP